MTNCTKIDLRMNYFIIIIFNNYMKKAPEVKKQKIVLFTNLEL